MESGQVQENDFSKSIKNALGEVLMTIPQMKAEYPEIEFRFGIIHPTENFFQADIPKELFDKIFSALNGCNEWTSKENEKSTDYFVKDNRLTHCAKGYMFIKKKKLASTNFCNEDCGLDLRLSVASEVPVKIPKKYEKKVPADSECSLIRHKERYSFIYDVWKYDLTILSLPGNPEKKYEIEIELLHPKYSCYKYTPQYLCDMAMNQINGILKILE